MNIRPLLFKNRSCRKIATCFVAALVGAGAFLAVAPALYAQSSTTTMCYRGRTIEVPNSLVSRYQTQGATIGACPVSPS